jgi:hypothetical protein
MHEEDTAGECEAINLPSLWKITYFVRELGGQVKCCWVRLEVEIFLSEKVHSACGYLSLMYTTYLF